MLIYLVRHAHALDGQDDAARPLSGKGRRQIRRMAAFLKRGDLLQAREFWHSPLVRARGTAERLAASLEVKARLVEVTGIEPFADPSVMAGRLARVRRPVAVVGHEPHLSALASLLVAGATTPARFEIKKCGVVALQRTRDGWVVRWQVSPDEI